MGVDISVVVPVFNSSRYLAQCTGALLSQDFPRTSYEIIMVDNNSRDDSAAIIRSRSGIRLLSEGRQGSYAARNAGVREARGSVIAFTDADCVPAPDWLSRISQTMADPSVGIVLGGRVPARPSRVISLHAAYINETHRYIFGQHDASLYYGYTNNMAVRTELLATVGPFVERYRGSDAILVQRAVDHLGTDSVRFDPGMLVRHLELAGTLDFYRKAFIYGLSRRRYRHLARVRGLRIDEKLLALRRTLAMERVSAGESVMLLALLAGAQFCYALAYAAAGLVPGPRAEPASEDPDDR